MLSADPFSQRYKPFSYSISSHTYCFYFGCECLRVLRMSFAVSRCIANPETCPLLAAAASSNESRSNEPRSVPTNQSTLGSQGGGGRSSNKPFRTESGNLVNTHTIQRCCMRNQCNFGKLHNLNLFFNNGNMISRNGHDMGPLTFYSDLFESKCLQIYEHNNA